MLPKIYFLFLDDDQNNVKTEQDKSQGVFVNPI